MFPAQETFCQIRNVSSAGSWTGLFAIIDQSISSEIHKVLSSQFAGEAKNHNVCKRQGLLVTGSKQTGMSPFSPRYPLG